MSVGPFDTDQVVTRLRDQVTGLRAVGGAADFAAAAERPGALPAAFVLLAREDAKPKAGGSAIGIQAIDVKFGVVLALQHYRSSERGVAQANALRLLIAEVRTVLLGWEPATDGPAERIGLVSGQILRYDQATVWWQETFSTRYWSRT